MTAALAQSYIEIRPLNPADFPIVWIWIEDSWRWIADDFFPKTLEAFIELNQRRNADHFAVYVDGDLCGIFTVIVLLPFVWECHVTFARRFLEPDETAEALRAAMQVARKFGCQTVICLAFPENKAIIRLLKRVGAVYEGRLRNRTQRDGKPSDLISYALLLTEE